MLGRGYRLRRLYEKTPLFITTGFLIYMRKALETWDLLSLTAI